MILKIIPPKKGSKYKNIKCIVNNITFDSLKEGRRYIDLWHMQRAGEISLLKMQVAFPILINSKKVCVYKADFVYYDKQGRQVVEDVKGMKTPVYKLKKKLLFLSQGVEIKEI